jgi:4,5-dihydroxyphthalate decarboxylase
MADLVLKLAVGDYDHVRDLADGKVRIDGVRIEHVDLPVEEIFARFTQTREWDISEMSLARYVALVSRGDPGLTGIPVFTSRFFRQHAIYVRSDGPVADPADLAGRRVGIPEWVQTAIVYVRAWLTHEVGIALSDIEWVRAAINSPALEHQVPPVLPDGVRYREAPDRALVDMLLGGEIDAIICAHPPELFERRDPRIRRLVRDWPAVERQYWERTGIFPIMHMIALRRDVYDRAPWIGPALCRGFEEAKRRSLERALDGNICRYPIPWAFACAERAREMFGDDFWPYGLGPLNQRTLEAFLRFSSEQGVVVRPLGVDELFPENVRGSG